MLTTDQKSGKMFKHLIGVSDTRVQREFFEEPIKSSFVITPTQMWTYGDHIPNGDSLSGGDAAIDSVKALTASNPIFGWQKDEATFIKIVKKFVNMGFTKIDDGTNNSFVLIDGNGEYIRNIIPFNYCKEVYNYTLRRDDGKKIPFGVGDWVFDTYSGILTFYGEVPTGVSAEHPPLFDFYQYVGGTGFRQDTYGLDGAILPIENYSIPEGSFSLSNAELSQAIINICDKVENDFVATYQWDGADNNEGVALSFEKLIPLKYTASKDAVKGYDDSLNAEVETLLTKRVATSVSPSFTVEFASQSLSSSNVWAVGFATVNGTMKVALVKDGIAGKFIDFSGSAGSLFKISDINSKSFIVIKKVLDTVAEETVPLTVSFSDYPTVGLFYWDSHKHEFLPFVTNESGTFDFGVPVACANGKIPPSISIGATSLGNYSDIITPDYYGNKTFSVVIAQENTIGDRSADYVVKNTGAFFLDDILALVLADHPDLAGTIYLRDGEYKIKGRTLDLTPFQNVTFKGESNVNTKVTADGITIVSFAPAGDKTGALVFEDLFFGKDVSISIDTSVANIVTFKGVVAPNSSLEVKQGDNIVIVRESNFGEVVVINRNGYGAGIDLVNSADISSYHTLIADSHIGIADIDICYAHVIGNTIGTAFLRKSNTLARANTIGTLATKVHGAIITGNDITTYDSSIAQNEIPKEATFQIYGAEGHKFRKYASFADPFEYVENENLIKLKYDSDVLTIINGKLTTCLTADKITLDPADYTRPSTAIDPVTKMVVPVTATTLEEALKDLYKTKADLIGGRVPLAQLPDSVAYSGLMFKGMWSFEKHGGVYPEFSDMTVLPDEVGFIKTIQSGWFMVVDASTDIDYPAKDQIAIDGTVYTAGDWLLFNGKNWEKCDKAYQDAAYAILPALDPDKKNWDWRRGGDGFLNFEKTTITEAFDRINELLMKITPVKPIILSRATLVEKTPFAKTELLTIAGNKKVYAYDVVRDPLTRRLMVGLLDEENVKHFVYYGDTGKLTAYVDGLPVGSVSLDADAPVQNAQDGALTVTKNKDPLANEIMGAGIWMGVIANVQPTADLSIGSHTYALGMTDTTPNNIADGAVSLSYLTYAPYIPTALAFSITAHNDTELNDRGNTGVCSGIPMLKSGFRTNIGFSLLKAFKDYIRSDLKVLALSDTITNEWLDCASYSIGANADDNSLSDIRVASVFKTYAAVQKVVESFDIKARIFCNDYNTQVDTVLKTLHRRIDPTTELERVCSGNGTVLFPVVDVDTDMSCGYRWFSERSLATIYTAELMKIGRNIANADGTTRIVSEYRFPTGKYMYGTTDVDFVDYNDCEGVTITGLDDGKKYRWATFEKFLDDTGKFVEVDLAEASGFELEFIVEDDKKAAWTQDNLSAVTDNLLCYAKVIGATGWLNCNDPFDGFAVPSNDGDPAMYAGSSTPTMKRVTFGKAVRTGKLLVRVAITDDSGYMFKGIKIRRII